VHVDLRERTGTEKGEKGEKRVLKYEKGGHSRFAKLEGSLAVILLRITRHASNFQAP
jgi:hypothetical protein